MTHSDTANNTVGDSKNLLADGIQAGSAKSDHFDGLNIPKENEFSVRSALLDDAVMMESIEREAFPGVIPLSRISRDITRNNGLYLKEKYKEIAECIKSGQVPSNDIVWYFNDEKFYKWYTKNYRKEPEDE